MEWMLFALMIYQEPGGPSMHTERFATELDCQTAARVIKFMVDRDRESDRPTFCLEVEPLKSAGTPEG